MRKRIPSVTVSLFTFLVALPLFAHEVPIDDQPIVDGVGTCLALGDSSLRNECYAKLCTPSYECAKKIVIAATENLGPRPATMALYDLMTEHQRFHIDTDGHEVAHFIGQQLAKHYGMSGEKFMECGNDFYYGCQHGFFQVALVEASSPSEAAKSICEQLDTAHKFFCYHGVGHGLMMAKDNDLKKTIDECDKMPEGNFTRQACWQGAFMENINTYLLKEDLPGMFKKSDPLHPCNKYEQRYQWECYYNHSAFLLDVANKSLPNAAKLCLKAAPQSVAPCIQGLGQFATNPGWQRVVLPHDFNDQRIVENGLKLCTEFPKDTQADCIIGALNNFVNYEHREDAMRFCSLLGDVNGERTSCYKEMMTIMSRPPYSSEQRLGVCNQMPETLLADCKKKVGLIDENRPTGILGYISHFFRSVVRFIDVFHWFT